MATPALSPAATRTRIALRPGEQTLVCLPPGSLLRGEEGCLDLYGGPCVLGQAAAPRVALGRLGADQQWSPGPEGTVWVHLANQGRQPARAWLVELATPPSGARLASRGGWRGVLALLPGLRAVATR